MTQRIRRAFTPGEDELIVRLRVGGMRLDAIAERVGRRKSSVQMRLDALAKREADDDEPFPI